MRMDKRVLAFKLAGMLVLSIFFSGCEALPDQQDSRGVKLSDAMHASASGDRHDLGGSRSSDSIFSGSSAYSDSAAAGSASAGSGGMEATVSYDKTEYDWQMLADVAYALPINSQFESLTRFTLTPIAVEGEEGMLGLYVGGADVQLKSGSLAAQATDRTWMLDAGLAGRIYLNHSRTALSPYLAANVGFTLLSWSYRNQVTAGGQNYQSDSLCGAEGMLGVGLSTRRDKHLGVFAEADIGGNVFAPVTVNGFDNDVFNNFGFICFKAGVSLKF